MGFLGWPCSKVPSCDRIQNHGEIVSRQRVVGTSFDQNVFTDPCGPRAGQTSPFGLNICVHILDGCWHHPCWPSSSINNFRDVLQKKVCCTFFLHQIIMFFILLLNRCFKNIILSPCLLFKNVIEGFSSHEV